MVLSIPLPPLYRLWTLALSHGWSDLPPFSIDRSTHTISFAFLLPSRRAVSVDATQHGRTLRCQIECQKTLTATDRTAIRDIVRSVLRIDEDLRPLHRIARQHPRYRWVVRHGAGRILRAPSAFEDTVKMICTTNCSWSLTVLMVSRLVQALGEPSGKRKAFPTAQAMAAKPESFYRNVIRAGYRSPYLLELARSTTSGTLDLERLRTITLTGEEKQELLLSVKGIGPYAADNLLRLHGVYDRFAHDSWITKVYSETYHEGRRVQNTTIERRYREFGPFQGLMYWLDMTRPWYERDKVLGMEERG